MQTFDARLIGSLASLPLGGLLDDQSSGWLDNQNSENVSGICCRGSFKYAMRKTFVMLRCGPTGATIVALRKECNKSSNANDGCEFYSRQVRGILLSFYLFMNWSVLNQVPLGFAFVLVFRKVIK